VVIDEQNKTMEIIVPDDQLSLAIGRRGQNVRLAAQLSNWKLDITSESRVKEMREFAKRSLGTIPGLDEATIELLYAHRVRKAKDFANANPELLLQMPGINDQNLPAMMDAAKSRMWDDEEELQKMEEAREAARIAEARRDPAELTQEERLKRVRGLGDRGIEQVAAAGYRTVEDIVKESDVVKFGETTGLGIKKARQVKHAAELYIQEETRLKAELEAERAKIAQAAAQATQEQGG
jgi:N utilization substance protein A